MGTGGTKSAASPWSNCAGASHTVGEGAMGLACHGLEVLPRRTENDVTFDSQLNLAGNRDLGTLVDHKPPSNARGEVPK